MNHKITSVFTSVTYRHKNTNKSMQADTVHRPDPHTLRFIHTCACRYTHTLTHTRGKWNEERVENSRTICMVFPLMNWLKILFGFNFTLYCIYYTFYIVYIYYMYILTLNSCAFWISYLNYTLNIVYIGCIILCNYGILILVPINPIMCANQPRATWQNIYEEIGWKVKSVQTIPGLYNADCYLRM